MASVDSVEPEVGVVSTMKLSKPVKIVLTDHAGFQVSGWKSEMDKHNLFKNFFFKLKKKPKVENNLLLLKLKFFTFD